MKQHQEVLQKYNYSKDKPFFSANNYSVWHGTQQETNLAVTIKIIKFPHIELPKYLKKLKDIKSQFVIKVFEVVSDQSVLLLITQQVTYGTLKKALAKCEHMEQNDAVFIARTLLNGHVDMLRADCNWFGTEDDIEFTDTGLKLSWNNSCPFNLVNPFANMINKLVARTEATKTNSLLPFPQIKAINELIKISKENASQISLHPQMKQKVKFSKRKGNGWMGLRQIKNKNEYFDEIIFLAVSNEHGFIRVKIYEQGKISPNLLALNKSKNTFSKVINIYDQTDKTIIVSQYSNDGNLQNYIKRLKAAGASLKEQHIEFFFVSLFQPIKSVQESTLKSINMLHIKNIYIQNGIPKIGEPIPMNPKINQIMVDRSQVPDFYYADFKKDPTSHGVNYDTYSLGVLLYKLMYTEYPIFPSGKVHIPTTPSYNKRLKTSLQIFLNEGGSLSELEKRIEVSQNVLKQVQQNKQKLKQGFGPIKEKKNRRDEKQEQEQQSQKPQTLSKISIIQQQKMQQVQSDDDEDDGCCNSLFEKMKLKPAEKQAKTYAFLDTLQESAYRKGRIWTKIILLLILYLFMFYYGFLSNNVKLISDLSILQTINVSISSNIYTITTSNYYNFQNTFTNQTLSSLQGTGLWCAIDSYGNSPVYSNTILSSSSIWVTYIITGLAALFVMLLLKIIQQHVLDEIKSLNYRQNGKGKFNLTNFVILNLLWTTLLSGHFYLYNFIYFGQIDPCFGFPNNVYYGSTAALFNNQNSFLNIYGAIFIAQLAIFIIYLIVIGCNQNMPYNKLFNPVTIFGVACIIFSLIVRFGTILKTYYYPTAANDPTSIIAGFFSRGQLMGILGILPEILLVIELAICAFVDWIFWILIDKSHSLLSNDASIANDGLDQLV